MRKKTFSFWFMSVVIGIAVVMGMSTWLTNDVLVAKIGWTVWSAFIALFGMLLIRTNRDIFYK